jgi:diguanylate cyclase (GGDEF)-like protein
LEKNKYCPKEQFLNILSEKNIYTVFQPIVSLRDGSVFGYEALTRGPVHTDMHSPQALFNCAERYGAIWELELLCRQKALEAVYNSNKQIKLFLNVNPNIMHDIKFKQGFTKEYLNMFSIDPENIIFEITENQAINNITDFKKIVQNYKDQNYKIAIDDAGAGFSGLNMISEIHPHYIKLDMNLIRDVDKDPTKYALIKSMYEYTTMSNTFLIAEGIETESELQKLIEIGVHYGQGFYIKKPVSYIGPIDVEISKIIKDINIKKNHILGNRISDIFISNICTPLRTLSPNMKISQVCDMVNNDSSLPGFCMTANDKIVGIITRNMLHQKLSGPYGYSLNYNKPISNIMSKDFLCVEHNTSIDVVAKISMQREQDKLYDFISITKDGKYLGVVTVKDLLEKSIQIEIVNAKHLNPLSELPGNILIEKHLESYIKSSKNYCVMYFDIDNFKAYNDVYGFEKGDIIIKKLSQIICSHIPKDEFVGHIGGDDFISVVCQDNCENLCKSIIDDFDKTIPNYYNEKDLRTGYIITKNRHGIEETFPILTLSIACITNIHFKNIYELSEKASNIKKQCKQRPDSCYIIV